MKRKAQEYHYPTNATALICAHTFSPGLSCSFAAERRAMRATKGASPDEGATELISSQPLLITF